MKVSELIERLQEMPQDMPVAIRVVTSCCCGSGGHDYEYTDPYPWKDRICVGMNTDLVEAVLL